MKRKKTNVVCARVSFLPCTLYHIVMDYRHRILEYDRGMHSEIDNELLRLLLESFYFSLEQ